MKNYLIISYIELSKTQIFSILSLLRKFAWQWMGSDGKYSLEVLNDTEMETMFSWTTEEEQFIHDMKAKYGDKCRFAFFGECGDCNTLFFAFVEY